MTYLYSLDILDKLDSSFYEDESCSFLTFYQSFKEWIVYDSDSIGLPTVYKLAEKFINFHGTIDFPEDMVVKDSYWTTVPLGIFKYKMLSDGSPYIFDSIYKDGYLVEGMYWSNGFFYTVKNKSTIVQIKLFIDSSTKFSHSYPDPV